MKAARPRLYFSFRSPYSWMTIERLRAAVPDAWTALDWYPYWDPDGKTAAALAERGAELPYAQMSRAKHLYILMDTKRLAQREGLAMSWPVDVDPWWELPHLAWLWARRLGRAEEFYDAVIAARWERGENICDPGVIRAAATEAGLDADAAVAAADDAAVREEGVDCLYAAYDDDVFGVPYLRWRRHRFWGFDRLDPFLTTWRGAEPPARTAEPPARGAESPAPVAEPPAPEPARVYDTDTAGGCG
jgi:2-hydroxychromene-2-carboxylate isomerase